MCFPFPPCQIAFPLLTIIHLLSQCLPLLLLWVLPLLRGLPLSLLTPGVSVSSALNLTLLLWGRGEFVIINPDFWGASKEEQDAMKGWYVFHAVSSSLLETYSYIDDVLFQWIESINQGVDPKP